MRVGMDLPRRSRHYPGGPIGVLGTLVLVAVAVFALRGVAVEATNYLWAGSVDLVGVWTKMMWTRIDLALAFAAIFLVACWTVMSVAARAESLPPPVIVVDPDQGPAEPDLDVATRYRISVVGRHSVLVRVIVSVVLAVLVGAGASAEWNNWILFTNAVPFGSKDPLFGLDVGFFVFKLPFLSFLAGWVFVALLVLAVVSVTTLYLNGSIRLQGEGQRVTPQAKTLLSVLMGMIALAKASGYFLSRYALDTSNRGYAEGAFFTAAHASLPALNLLVLVALVCSVIFVVNIRRRGWALPVVSVALWAFVAVVAGAIYPAIVQTFGVSPDQIHKEAPYIGLNIAATRKAMGISNVVTQPLADSQTLTAASAAAQLPSLREQNVWDPTFALASFEQLDAVEPYFSFNSAQVDRYNLSGTLTPTIMAVRSLAGAGSSTWINQHLTYTHGEGAVLLPANAATANGSPELVVSGLPPTSAPGAPVITQPEVYFGEGMSGYAIASTAHAELDYPGSAGRNVESHYKGAGGVAVGGLVRRAAFALRFGSLDLLTSDLVRPTSKVMFVRDVEARVKKAAPFLAYDANPYAVIVNGQIEYVIDAYTTTSAYPYAQQADVSSLASSGPGKSGLDTTFNYVRNSVTVAVNAYSGAMTFYLVDPSDPIGRAYDHAFPGLFTSGTAMPDALKAQLRYPQDLFTVQAAMLGRYHLKTVAGLYTAANLWTSSQAPGTGAVTYSASSQKVDGGGARPVTTPGGTATTVSSTTTRSGADATTARPSAAASGAPGASSTTSTTANVAAGASQAAAMAPTYQVSQLPGDPSLTFNTMIPFVSTSSAATEGGLTGLLVARSTPGKYGLGELEIYETPTGKVLAGPGQVSSQIHQDPAVSTRISELIGQGDTVSLGTVQAVPVGQSLLWVRPLYAESGKYPSPRLNEVIVAYGSRTAMEPTFAKALADLVGQAVPGLGSGSAAPLVQLPPSAVSSSVKDLVADANAELGTAQGELRQGDLSAYQADVERAQILLGEVEKRLSPPPSALPGAKSPAVPKAAVPKAAVPKAAVPRPTSGIGAKASVGSA